MPRTIPPPARTKILLVDDHLLLREGLRRCLSAENDFEIVGETGSGQAALELAESSHAEIALLDIDLPDVSGVVLARQLRDRLPKLKIVFLTGLIELGTLNAALDAGALGYVAKNNATADLVRAIRAAREGKSYLSPEASDLLIGGYRQLAAAHASRDNGGLSERETDVLRLLAGGKSTKEIAGELKLSTKTVESHRSNLSTKLNLFSVAELTKYAIRRGLTSL